MKVEVGSIVRVTGATGNPDGFVRLKVRGTCNQGRKVKLAADGQTKHFRKVKISRLMAVESEKNTYDLAFN